MGRYQHIVSFQYISIALVWIKYPFDPQKKTFHNLVAFWVSLVVLQKYLSLYSQHIPRKNWGLYFQIFSSIRHSPHTTTHNQCPKSSPRKLSHQLAVNKDYLVYIIIGIIIDKFTRIKYIIQLQKSSKCKNFIRFLTVYRISYGYLEKSSKIKHITIPVYSVV